MSCFRIHGWWLGALCVVGALGLATAAAEEGADGISPPGQEPVPAQRSRGLLGTLLESVEEPEEQAPSTETPLERAVRGMRQAGARLEQDETGEETRTLQRDVVRQLDELLKAAQQQQSSASPQSPKPQQSSAEQPKPSQPQQQAKAGSGEAAGEGSAQQTRSDDAAESTERADRGELKEAEARQRLRLTKDVWGHLPPNIRQQLLNVYSEKHLPQYEELIRAYYEALAEQSRRP